ncbi:MAG: hypothetical protein DRI39_10575 [Chloroflexi bacterium]|nr:MAG: hypothetical protein DRI39_10575 [Chloroflexota bacterium]
MGDVALEVLLSFDGGRSFEAAPVPCHPSNTVIPRVDIRDTGEPGWYVTFVYTDYSVRLTLISPSGKRYYLGQQDERRYYFGMAGGFPTQSFVYPAVGLGSEMGTWRYEVWGRSNRTWGGEIEDTISGDLAYVSEDATPIPPPDGGGWGDILVMTLMLGMMVVLTKVLRPEPEEEEIA